MEAFPPRWVRPLLDALLNYGALIEERKLWLDCCHRLTRLKAVSSQAI